MDSASLMRPSSSFVRFAMGVLVALAGAFLLTDAANAYGKVNKFSTPDFQCSSGLPIAAGHGANVDTACEAHAGIAEAVLSGSFYTGSGSFSNEHYSWNGIAIIKHVSCTPTWGQCGAPFDITLNVSTQNLGSVSACPANSVEDTSLTPPCLCNEGWTAVVGQCEPMSAAACVEAALDVRAQSSAFEVTALSTSFCYEGCKFQAAMVSKAPDGKFWIHPGAGVVPTGGFCQGTLGTGSTVNPAPIPCPVNQCPGTVNGTNVCVACSSSTAAPKEVSSAASGAASSVPSSNPADLDGVPGAASKSERVTCTGDECVTTTTYRDAAGAEIGAKEEKQDQKTFCEENPSLSICKATSFSGSCASGVSNVSCEGDAIQCALSKVVHAAKCAWDKVDSSLVDKGQAAITAGAVLPDDHPGSPSALQSTSFQFSALISQTNLLGSSGCPGDEAFSFNGRSVVIPWSKACSSLQLLGQVVLALSMLSAAFIVFRK